MTKKGEKKPSEKEIKELWWEYLKRSDKYKLFCEKGFQLGSDYFGDCYWPFVQYLRYFGKIFEQSFENWWIGPLRKRWGSVGSYPVLDLRDQNSYHSLYFYSLQNLTKETQKEIFPSPKKIWKIIQQEPKYIFLAVPVVGNEDTTNIVEQIKMIRNCYKKTTAVREVDKQVRNFLTPSTRMRYDELKTYLEVYDLRKQGMKMTEVIKRINPMKNEKDAITQREFNRFLSNAKKIIKNVENGSFPGKY